jgi:hypothetical protein
MWKVELGPKCRKTANIERIRSLKKPTMKNIGHGK